MRLPRGNCRDEEPRLSLVRCSLAAVAEKAQVEGLTLALDWHTRAPNAPRTRGHGHIRHAIATACERVRL